MDTNWKGKIRKPDGVYVMCLLMFANFGAYQFYYDFVAMKLGERETPLLIAVILIGLDVFCATSSVWCFFGDNSGRIFLLIFVSLNMLWSVFILILNIAYAIPRENGYYDSNILFYGLTLVKPLMLFGLCWWYFTQKSIIAYYRQENNYEFF